MLRSLLSAVFSVPPLTAIGAAVGSDLQDLQNQIEQVSTGNLKDALMCISDVAWRSCIGSWSRCSRGQRSWA